MSGAVIPVILPVSCALAIGVLRPGGMTSSAIAARLMLAGLPAAEVMSSSPRHSVVVITRRTTHGTGETDSYLPASGLSH